MTKKFVAVLNKKIEPGRAINALGHMTIGLLSQLSEDESQAINYQDQDGGAHIGSKLPFIILKAKNSNKISTLRHQLIEKNIPFASFNNCMIEKSWEEQIEISSRTSEEDLEYFGVCMYGDKDVLDELTKKFSLF